MKIVIYIYNGMTMLDAIGPYEVLRNVQDFDIKFVSKEPGEIAADSQLIHVNSKIGIAEIQEADILLIPGSTIAFIKEMKDKKVLDWIKKIDNTTQLTISVCTGSLILAAAGLLKERQATSHWKAIEMLSNFGVIPIRDRVVESAKYISASGVSAGIDMAIYLINKLKGEKEAKAAQLAIEYDPNPMFSSGNYSTADEETITLSGKNLERFARNELNLMEVKN